MKFTKEQVLEAARKCTASGTTGQCWGCIYTYDKECMLSLVQDLLELVETTNKKSNNEIDLDTIAGKWFLPLEDKPWVPGYFGRCSKCSYIHTASSQSVPLKCPKCKSLMKEV